MCTIIGMFLVKTTSQVGDTSAIYSHSDNSQAYELLWMLKNQKHVCGGLETKYNLYIDTS